ncbi:hypothetical protein CBR_g46413 [Chara braunii]|uniref:protein acetyllysine N-acetyltransferase n=1 Tax=Chara braunii TaxID=69332 RepID=A0A388M0E5_CHABU|nr:hypothetical protein CBR_g46413 [Chara braunii]|eukprot:GBG88044.1 hypothetical protein CBR_g46413 [Chara braunii]
MSIFFRIRTEEFGRECPAAWKAEGGGTFGGDIPLQGVSRRGGGGRVREHWGEEEEEEGVDRLDPWTLGSCRRRRRIGRWGSDGDDEVLRLGKCGRRLASSSSSSSSGSSGSYVSYECERSRFFSRCRRLSEIWRSRSGRQQSRRGGHGPRLKVEMVDSVPDDVSEKFDPPEVLAHKIDRLGDMIRDSQYMVAYTGAGISTSVGIPDFRGPEGVWTLRAKGLSPPRRRGGGGGPPQPSLTHMALVELINRGKLKFLISQNTDVFGLHLRSGVDRRFLAELHGNTNSEICRSCGEEYWRPFSTREAYHVHDHKTSRRCDRCGSVLEDSIINFNEALPARTLQKAMQQSDMADLGLALGSSLRVSPAADLPLRILRRGKPVVIVNLQTTPIDPVATMKINARVDEVMEGVMRKLGWEIPPVRDLLTEERNPPPAGSSG